MITQEQHTWGAFLGALRIKHEQTRFQLPGIEMERTLFLPKFDSPVGTLLVLEDMIGFPSLCHIHAAAQLNITVVFAGAVPENKTLQAYLPPAQISGTAWVCFDPKYLALGANEGENRFYICNGPESKVPDILLHALQQIQAEQAIRKACQ